MTATMTMTMAHSPSTHALQSIGESAEQRLSHSPFTLGMEPYPNMPVLVYSTEQKALKSEDVIFVQRVEPRPGMCHSLFMVCDGHQGVEAAAFTTQHLPQMLGQSLPPHLPDWEDSRAVEEFAETIRRVLSTAVVELENKWTELQCTAGTTMTLALVSGWLLTMANTGDSNAVLDDGVKVVEVTNSHRIQANKAEQNRLRQAGAQLAPLGFHLQGPAKPQEMGVGPLRLWPGGLCVSRSIGDLDSGPLVVPLPHVRQLLLPKRGGLRLIMASDGLWDLMTFSKAAKSIRHKLPVQAVTSLIQAVVKDRRMADDVSIIILDMLASEKVPFPSAALQQAAAAAGTDSSSSSSGNSRRKGGSGGGLFSCFKSTPVLEAAPVAPDPKGWYVAWKYLADVDCLEAYPRHRNQLAKSSMPLLPPVARPARPSGDFTVHGGARAHMFRAESDWHTDRTMHGSGRSGSMVHGGTNGSSSGYGSSGHGGNSAHSTGVTSGGMGVVGVTSGGVMYSLAEQYTYPSVEEIQAAAAAAAAGGQGSGGGGPELPPTALQQTAQFPNGRMSDQVPMPFGGSVMGPTGSGGSLAGGGDGGGPMPMREGGVGQLIVRSNSELFERDCEAGDSVRGAMRVIPSVGSAPVPGGFSHEVRHLEEEGEGLPSALAAAEPYVGSGTP